MGRMARNRERSNPRPVEKIELSEGNTRRRMIAAALLLALGATALVYAFYKFITPDSGWQEIKADSTAGITCAGEFMFYYEVGAGKMPASAEAKEVKALYSKAARTAYQMFNRDEAFDDVVSVYEINRHPNEVLEVDEALYQAFAAIQSHGDRAIYLGPVYVRYDDMFSCTDDAQIVDFDPQTNEEVRQEYAEIAAFAADPESIDLQLLEGNQIKLYVSDAYLAYAKQEGVENFIDFFWMKNAFIVDYLAQTMMDAGFVHGAISSYDGFVRNLDDRKVSYSLNVYDYADDMVYLAAAMDYKGALSAVSMRNYLLTSMDKRHSYQLQNGEVRTSYLDVQDAVCKSAVNDLICYSRTQSCAEVLLAAKEVYIAETLDKGKLSGLAAEGIYSIYSQDRIVIENDPNMTLTKLYNKDGVTYTTES